MYKKLLLTLLIATCGLSACSVNPVTGKANFQIYGSDWEREVGAQMYAPMKQSQGGDWNLDPELTAYVQDVGSRLAAQARRKEEMDFEFSILNDSVPNAWALPGGKIVINRGLLTELDSESELAAVLGHEIVHADAAHTARAQSKGMVTQAGAVISMVILGSTIDSQATREVAMMVPALGAQMLSQKYGRDAERESDEYGMLYMSEAGYDPQGAVELQKTFVKLSEDRNQDWLSGLFASHPPSRERVENNQKSARELPSGGENGRERYREKTAYLRRVQPAYDAFDEAKKALANDNIKLAQEKLNRAVSIEPRESRFQDLQGDLYALNKDHKRALSAYNRSLRANPGFFYAYLRKGQMEYQLKQYGNARSSLNESLELMPTAEAHYTLGMMDKAQGNTRDAMEHFTKAAGTDSETGKKANGELARMELGSNPSKYIASRVVLDQQGMVWVQFLNRTSLSVRDIEISYAWLDNQGQTQQSKKTYRGPLGGGQQDQLSLGIRLESAADISRQVRAEVSAARLAE